MSRKNILTPEYPPVLQQKASVFMEKQEELDTVAAVAVRNMSVSYNGKVAVNHVSLDIRKKQITGIIGPNGAGKSTLIKGILGIVKTTQDGSTLINGLELSTQRKKIAYVEQRNILDLSFPICVEEVVLLGTYPNLGFFHNPGREEKKKVQEALAKVEMQSFSKRQIGELSGGQLQRVFIARALAQEADLFLLDEPFIGIDAISESLIMTVLKNLSASGKTVVIVNHDLHKVEEYFDDVILLNGNLIAHGPVDQIFTTDNIQQAYGQSMGSVMVQGVEE